MNFRTVKPSKALISSALNSVDNDKAMFNISGEAYRKGGFKDKVASMKKSEIVLALFEDPMLIKRPIVRSKKGIVVGWDEKRIKKII